MTMKTSFVMAMIMMSTGAVSTVKGDVSTATSASVSDVTDLFVSGNSSQPWSKDLGQVCYR